MGSISEIIRRIKYINQVMAHKQWFMQNKKIPKELTYKKNGYKQLYVILQLLIAIKMNDY